MSIFKKYLEFGFSSDDEEGDEIEDSGWSPLMKKHLKKKTKSHENIEKEKEIERRSLSVSKHKDSKTKEHERRGTIKRDWKKKEDEREEESERQKEITLYEKDNDDQKKLVKWLKDEFGDSLTDVVGDLLDWNKDDKDYDVEQAIADAQDFSVKDMIQGHDPKKFKRLQELKRTLEWDWEGWLFDEMADRARDHHNKKK